MKTQYFLMRMQDGLTPIIAGPWDTEEARDMAAKESHEIMSEEDNLFWLDINQAEPLDYAWLVKFNDIKSWMAWIKLKDEEKLKFVNDVKKTSVPGGTFVIGPNMEVEEWTPTLNRKPIEVGTYTGGFFDEENRD